VPQPFQRVTPAHLPDLMGSRFHARILDRTSVDGRPAVIPEVAGMAYKTGEHTFCVDSDDTLVPGFVFR